MISPVSITPINLQPDQSRSPPASYATSSPSCLPPWHTPSPQRSAGRWSACARTPSSQEASRLPPSSSPWWLNARCLSGTVTAAGASLQTLACCTVRGCRQRLRLNLKVRFRRDYWLRLSQPYDFWKCLLTLVKSIRLIMKKPFRERSTLVGYLFLHFVDSISFFKESFSASSWLFLSLSALFSCSILSMYSFLRSRLICADMRFFLFWSSSLSKVSEPAPVVLCSSIRSSSTGSSFYSINMAFVGATNPCLSLAFSRLQILLVLMNWLWQCLRCSSVNSLLRRSYQKSFRCRSYTLRLSSGTCTDAHDSLGSSSSPLKYKYFLMLSSGLRYSSLSIKSNIFVLYLFYQNNTFTYTHLRSFGMLQNILDKTDTSDRIKVNVCSLRPLFFLIKLLKDCQFQYMSFGVSDDQNIFR